jgi:hypothetical protein
MPEDLPVLHTHTIDFCTKIDHYQVKHVIKDTHWVNQAFLGNIWNNQNCHIPYFMEQSPWEANQFAASQEIPHILWDLKVHYCIHKCPLPFSIFSHTSTSHFLKIHLNIILPSMPGSPQWSLFLRFPHQNPVHASPFPHLSYMPCPSHPSRFYHLHNSVWGVQIMELHIMKASVY